MVTFEFDLDTPILVSKFTGIFNKVMDRKCISLAGHIEFQTRFHLYTVPGQVFYDASRKLILKGVDGVIFVADSQEPRMDANIEALENLDSNLKEHGFDLKVIPYVLQFNKRDLPTAVSLDEMIRALRYKDEPYFEAIAPKGVGVFDTLKACAKQILVELSKK